MAEANVTEATTVTMATEATEATTTTEATGATGATGATTTTEATGVTTHAVMPSWAQRTAEIMGVLADHNFYVNGFTPRELRTTLEDLGPTYVKIGQIMSSRTDMLPRAYCEELETLRSSVAPLSAEVARSVIEQETGRRIEELYQEFRDEPLGSASIAQAHFGVLLDGTPVVTKVQRPLIADMMRRDFVLLRKLAALVGIIGEEDEGQDAVDLRSVVAELEKVTEEELDFRVEAANTRSFRELCIEDDAVVSCPRIIDELTTERILTMTYVDGYSLSHAERIDADGYDRTQIGTALIDNYLHQVLDAGMFHGDPHQGNIMIDHGVPCWIDFGMMGRIDETSASVFTDVIFALVTKDVEALTDAALALGQPRGKVNRAKLVDDVDAMVSRYGSTRSLADLNLGALMGELTELMADNHIVMPGEYTMLARSLATFEGVIEELCPELDLMSFLGKRMSERMQRDADLMEQLGSTFESAASGALRVARLPGLASDVLNNLAKGRLKIAMEPTGLEEQRAWLSDLLLSVAYVVFACVLLIASAILCTAPIEPQAGGMPLLALIGFVVAVALGLHALRRLGRQVRS